MGPWRLVELLDTKHGRLHPHQSKGCVGEDCVNVYADGVQLCRVARPAPASRRRPSEPGSRASASTILCGGSIRCGTARRIGRSRRCAAWKSEDMQKKSGLCTAAAGQWSHERAVFAYDWARLYHLNLCTEYRPLAMDTFAQIKEDAAWRAGSTNCATTPPMAPSPSGEHRGSWKRPGHRVPGLLGSSIIARRCRWAILSKLMTNWKQAGALWDGDPQESPSRHNDFRCVGSTSGSHRGELTTGQSRLVHRSMHDHSRTRRSTILTLVTLCWAGCPQGLIAVAYVAEDHDTEVIDLGPMGTRPCDIDHLVRQLQSKATHLVFVYEAGPCGYWLYRYLTKKGVDCWVVPPSLIPKRGSRPRQNRSSGCRPIGPADALRGFHPGQCPQREDEASRDLSRAREETLHDLKTAKFRLKAFCSA